jgi:hypothetical protein
MSQNPLDPPEPPQRQFKGVWLCAAILDDGRLSPAAKILLAEIDSLTHAEKACYASNEFLAKRLHVTAVHMNGLLSDLTRAGYLIRLAFTGRQTRRCIHPIFSSNAETVHDLLSQYNVRLPERRPGEADPTQGSLGKKPKAETGVRVGKKDKAALAQKTRLPLEKTQPEISNTDTKEKTTTTPIEGGQAKGPPPAAADPPGVVVVDSLEDGFKEEERRIEALMESLAPGFVLNGHRFKLSRRQMEEVRACAKGNGLGYVQEKLTLTRAEAKKNPVKFLMDALAEDWQLPITIGKQPKEPKPELKPEEPPSALADFSAELAWWQSATDAQREEILKDPRFDLYRKSMRRGVTTASLGLPVLRQVLAERAHQATCAATASISPQQPEEQAAA